MRRTNPDGRTYILTLFRSHAARSGSRRPAEGHHGGDQAAVSCHAGEQIDGSRFEAGIGYHKKLRPRELFELPLRSSAGPTYEPSRNGHRSLVLTSPEVASQSLTLIVNWSTFAEERIRAVKTGLPRTRKIRGRLSASGIAISNRVSYRSQICRVPQIRNDQWLSECEYNRILSTEDLLFVNQTPSLHCFHRLIDFPRACINSGSLLSLKVKPVLVQNLEFGHSSCTVQWDARSNFPPANVRVDNLLLGRCA